MTRIVKSLNAAEIDKDSITMVVMVEIAYDSGTIFVHDGVGEIRLLEYLLQENTDNILVEDGDLLITETDASVFLGTGEFGTIDSVEENIEVIARQVTMTLSGLDTRLLTPALSEPYQNRTVTIYAGFVNITTGKLVASPEVVWEGRINQQSLSLAKGEAVLTMTCEHRLRREPRIARYTDADQKQAFPADEFFNLTHTIEGFVGKWGQRDVAYGGGGGTPGDFENDRNIVER